MSPLAEHQDLSALLGGAFEAMLVWDAAGVLLELNAAAENLLGFPAGEVRGTLLFHQLFPPTLRGGGRAEQTGEPLRPQAGVFPSLLVRRADGTECSAGLKVTKLPGGGGPLFLACLRELPKEEQTAPAMQAQARRWHLLLKQASVSVQIFAPDGTTIAVNRLWEDLFRLPRDQILGWNVLEDPIVAAGGRRSLMERAFAGQPVVIPPSRFTLPSTSVEAECEKWIGALMYPIHDDFGQILEVICIHDDATAQRLAEQRILELNAGLERQVAERTAELARFATISDMTHDFLGIADMAQRVLYVNPAGRAMLGWGPQATDQSRTVQEVYTEWSYKIILEETIPKALQDDVWTGDLAVQHVDGHEIPVSMVGIIVKDKEGRPEFMSAIMRDTSARARIEQELHRALRHERELSRLKSNFVSMVSHEFRTPLAIILSSSEILDHFLESLGPGERREHLDSIKDSVARMTALMEQVLTFSRMESGELECHPHPLDLRVFCARLLDELGAATAHRCPVAFTMEGLSEDAVADEKLLRPILSNLLTNAIKYSTMGEEVRFAVWREDESALFEVADHGLGIPKADQANLFTAFRRASNVADLPGTGLGLVIVRKCVDAHGGQIHFTSQENRGTTARVALPLFRKTAAPSVAALNSP